MSDPPRTGPKAPPRPVAPTEGDTAGAGFDIGDISAAIADLTADVHRGPVQAVELPQAVFQPTPGGPDLSNLEHVFAPTDEHLPLEGRPPPAESNPPRPAPSAVPVPVTPPPTARPLSSAPPERSMPAPSTRPAPPPAAPVTAAPPAARPIQNVETAFVRNPLLGPPPASRSAPPPAAAPPPVVPQAAPAEPYGPTTGQPEVREPPRGRLVVQGGDWNGTTWYLNRAETRLGRGEQNDIVVLDIGVSRQHFVVARHAEGFRLIDLGSGNGTYLNGARVAESELFDGDRIDLGHTTLVFGTIGPPRLRPPGTGEHDIRGGMPVGWLVAMALVTFLTVLGTMYLVRTIKGGDGAEAAVTTVRDAMGRRSWSEAREAIAAAREDGVEGEELDTLADRVEREARTAKVVDRAREVLGVERTEGGGDRVDAAKAVAAEVESMLADVPGDSVYAGDARTLIQMARQRSINARLDKAEDFLGSKRTAAARIQVEQILKEDTGNARARAMLRRIEQLE